MSGTDKQLDPDQTAPDLYLHCLLQGHFKWISRLADKSADDILVVINSRRDLKQQN